MAYDLSFSPEFFLAEGEPYDRQDFSLNAEGKPLSVWSAIEMMRLEPRGPIRNEWDKLAKDIFGLDNAGYLSPETVLEKIKETNTCSNLTVPVRVWIDSAGDYAVYVYDGPEKERE